MVTTMCRSVRFTHGAGIWKGTSIPPIWKLPPVMKNATGSFALSATYNGDQIAKLRQSSEVDWLAAPDDLLCP
jgi:hypothetical protein